MQRRILPPLIDLRWLVIGFSIGLPGAFTWEWFWCDYLGMV